MISWGRGWLILANSPTCSLNRHDDDDDNDGGENYDDDDGGDNDGVGGDDDGQCVHRREGQVRSSGTAHCSTATWKTLNVATKRGYLEIDYIETD